MAKKTENVPDRVTLPRLAAQMAGLTERVDAMDKKPEPKKTESMAVVTTDTQKPNFGVTEK